MSNSVKSMKALSKLYESIYDGNVGDDGKEKEEQDTTEENEEKEKDTDSKDSSNDNSSKKSDKDTESNDTDDKDDKDSEDSENKGHGSSIKGKIKSLQKQYNDLLIGAFEKYSGECIDQALSDTEGAFGEKIADVVDVALNLLKGKVLAEFGIKQEEPPAVMSIGVAGLPNIQPQENGEGQTEIVGEPKKENEEQPKEDTEEKDDGETEVKEESKKHKSQKHFKPRYAGNEMVDMKTKVHRNEKDKNKERKFDWKKAMEDSE